jgi:hypothetical protein
LCLEASPDDEAFDLLSQAAEVYGPGFWALGQGDRSWAPRVATGVRRNAWWIAAGLVLLSSIPVRLSVLAPAEVIALEAAAVVAMSTGALFIEAQPEASTAAAQTSQRRRFMFSAPARIRKGPASRRRPRPDRTWPAGGSTDAVPVCASVGTVSPQYDKSVTNPTRQRSMTPASPVINRAPIVAAASVVHMMRPVRRAAGHGWYRRVWSNPLP